MKNLSRSRFTLLLLAALLLPVMFGGCGKPAKGTGEKTVIRIGHFPNITHAQALVAAQLTRQGKGWFEERLGPGVEIQWYVYNAGPSAMEAIFTKSVDVTYVGPNPVLNAYGKSKGQEIRVLAGSARGGAALVVPGDGRLSKGADFKGKTLATPQLGNTQDVAARAWLKKQGFTVTQIGGDVSVLPTANPDQLSLFKQGKIDAAWTVEPWVTRLEREAGGKVMIEEKDALTTVLASSVKFLNDDPALAKKFVAAHVELTKWITDHPAEAQELVRAELKEITKSEFNAEVCQQAWRRLNFASDINRGQFDSLVTEAQSVGFLREMISLDKLIAPQP